MERRSRVHFFAAIDENGKTCLHTFFGKWPGYQSRECLRHEEFDHFSIGDTGVTVKVDFASWTTRGHFSVSVVAEYLGRPVVSVSKKRSILFIRG